MYAFGHAILAVQVFADLMSQPARAVVIFCRAAAIPHQHVNIKIAAGETKARSADVSTGDTTVNKCLLLVF